MRGQLITPQKQELPFDLAGQTGFGPSILSPADLRKIVLKRKWILIVCILLGVIVGGCIAFLSVPQYQATASVDIDLTRSTNIGISNLIQQRLVGEDSASERLLTQIQIMRSDTVLLNVIHTLDLYHKRPFAEVFRKTPYNGTLTPKQRAALLQIMSGNLKILVLPGTNLVQVKFSNPDPVVATNVTNAIVDAYMERDLRARYEGTLRVSSWLSEQLNALKKQVQDAQQAVIQFQRKNDLVGTTTDGDSLVAQNLRTVNQQLAEAEADRIVKEARYKLAQTRNPELLASVAPGSPLQTLRQQQSELMVQYAQLKAKYGPEWPKLKEAEKQLATVQDNINAEINNLTNKFEEEYNAAVNTENLLRSRLEQIKQEAYRANSSEVEFEILKHGADSASDLYDALQIKLKEAGITAGLNSNAIDVIDRATQPAKPISPIKRLDLALGLFGGALVGILIALLVESLDDTLRTSEDVEAISGLPSLAVIPHFATSRKISASGADAASAIDKGLVASELVSYLEPHSIGAEGFRTLRSSILLSSVDREPRLILLTSGLAAEGKSTCAANLAISFARRSARVLLVDTDLRKGTLHLKFKTSNRAGLSTLLARESGEEAYERPVPDLPNLTLLTRGPVAPNPGEMLGSRSMEDLLLQWRLEYDHIILDTSPILPVADTLSIAPHVDVAFIVVRAGITRKKALLRVRDQLLRVNTRLLGTVMNDVDLRLENYYTYSRHYDYGYKSYGAGYGAPDVQDAKK
ncbi:MAG: polysaccharide biosynthesis tyrosine autokinase [Bacillota bacterium]|nr:polysaccharide biosynthesis tyrosine autokinase [Bacillota bacterium]